MNHNLNHKSPLLDWLSWQEKSHPVAWDLGLERIGKVWQRLGAPKIAKNVLTIAGTNGKGSCVAIAEALGIAMNKKIASFTSPHLFDYKERIRFNGNPAADEQITSAFAEIDRVREDISLTYFEWSALACFYLMANADLDLAILEVGLGGRLDAVNLIDADAVIIAKIGLDHLQYLGSTITEIAGEKMGVLRSNQLAVLTDSNSDDSLYQKAKQIASNTLKVGKEISAKSIDDDFYVEFFDFKCIFPKPKQLLGDHQLGHIAGVVAVFDYFFDLTRIDFARASNLINHFGRLSLIKKNGNWLFDVAHNQDSAQVLANFLQQNRNKYRKIYGICSILNDKDHQAIFSPLVNQFDRLWLFGLDNYRGCSADFLQAEALKAGFLSYNLKAFQKANDAFNDFIEQGKNADLLVVTGSFVTVGQIYQMFKQLT